jgi:uncharacterized membrane protein
LGETATGHAGAVSAVPPIARTTSAGRRVLSCATLGFVAFGIAMALAPWQVAVLLGWDTTGMAFVGWVFLSIRGKDGAATACLATREDNSRAIADAVLISAGLATLIGVGATLLKAATEKGGAHVAMTSLAGLTVVVSWACVHTVFTLRYARLYYSGNGGMDFHEDRRPDFGDFAYVALTLGMTYQVSDTDLTSKPIRVTALRHAILSYLFGTVIIAVTINVVAGLLSK